MLLASLKFISVCSTLRTAPTWCVRLASALFNLQGTTSAWTSQASLPPPGCARRRKLASVRSCFLFKSKPAFRFETRGKGGPHEFRFRGFRRGRENSFSFGRFSSSSRTAVREEKGLAQRRALLIYHPPIPLSILIFACFSILFSQGCGAFRGRVLHKPERRFHDLP